MTPSHAEVERGHYLAGQYIMYTYTGNVSRAFSKSSSEEMSVDDKFSYRLYDSFGASSTLGTAWLTITSRLRAVTAQSQGDPSWICEEDTQSRISVYAQDTAESRRRVAVVVTALPERGNLYREDTRRALAVGDILETECSEPPFCVSSVTYRPDKDYFNSPTSKWNGDVVSEAGDEEFFRYFAVANDNGEYSNEVVQEIKVINSNDPSILQCPSQPQHVEAVGISLYSGRAAFVSLDRIVIRGFSIVDPDNGVDIVKVKVSTFFGLLSLNSDHVSLLDFNSAAYCYEGKTSQCFGSGTSDRELVFFAEPRHAKMALDGMVYQSVASDVRDDINVTIFDGANGACLGEAKFQPGSVREECWQAFCQFHVTVGRLDGPGGPVEKNRISAQVWVSAILSLIVLICLRCGRCCTFKRLLDR